jgi:DNA repair exonuclease SbcCD ATPase subunit
MVLFILAFVIAAIGAIIRYVSYFNSTSCRIQSIFSFLAGIISFLAGTLFYLAELFVVTKPVEFSQGLLVDLHTYNRLTDGREQMERKIVALEAKMSGLEQIAHWCSLHHADPDATTQKIRQNQLAATLQQLERLRREHSSLQNHCRRLEDGKEDVKKTDIAELRKVIETKDLEIGGLRATITALEARPDTEKLKAESERARELQQKLDAHIKEATSNAIAALNNEEMAKLEASNKSLRLGLKAAEERAQAVASSHQKTMDEAKKKMEVLEVAAGDVEYRLGQAREEASAAKAALERLQQELETANATKAAERERLSKEVEAVKVQLQGRFDDEIRAARKGLAEAAEAAEADFNARVEDSIATQIQAARKELAEAAEADIKSRVEEQLVSRVAEAIAEKAEAEAALAELNWGAFDEEFEKIAEECGEMIRAREAEAAANATTTTTNTNTNMDTTMSTNLAVEPSAFAAPKINFGGPVAFLAVAPAAPISVVSAPFAFTGGLSAATTTTGRKKATGKRIAVGKPSGGIPGLNQLPDHVVRHAQAQEEAAAIAAFKANFYKSDLPDVDKPFEGELKKDEISDSEDPYPGW